MHILKKFNQFFGFTPTESKVVVFLLVTFIAGGALKVYRSYFPSAFLPRFDYSKEDQEFALRSKLIDSIEAGRLQFVQGRSQTSGKEKSAGSRKTKALQSPINLNTATKEELMKLPGVGEVIAERILLYREEKGRFRDISELKNIRGIGDKTFEKLRPWVKVE